MPPEAVAWVEEVPGGALLRLRVSPGATRTAVAGEHAGALRVRVAARPVEGAANRELVRFLAAALGVRPPALTIEAGLHGRDKRVRVEGVGAATVAARLMPTLSVDTPGGEH
jgi:uncharacterized protein (TIGR00251 family)